MRYQGGKVRASTEISNVITTANKYDGGRQSFVSLFCGGCAVEAKVAPYFDKVICSDKQPYIIALWQGVQNGYDLPQEITREQYYYTMAHKDEDKVLTGFIGFGCSFGGKFFCGYAQATPRRDYPRSTRNTCYRDMKTLQKAEFICRDYREVEIPKNSVIYCDPPYEGTTGYKTAGKFNSKDFWAYMRVLSKAGHTVYISEEHAPDDFKCIWEKPIKRTLDRNKNNNFYSTEKLFVYDNED